MNFYKGLKCKSRKIVKMSKQLTHARNVLWHGQVWSVMVVVDTFSAFL